MPTVRKPTGEEKGRYTIYLLARRRGIRYGGRIVFREKFDLPYELKDREIERWHKEVDSLRFAARMLLDHAATIEKYHSTQDKRRVS